MALETATYISGLVSSNPPGTDPKSQGDDHLRLIKATLLNTFPNITGAVSATHTELNYVAGVTSSIQTQLNSKLSSVSISQLTAAAANQTIDNTAYQLAWGWKLTGASDVALNLTESAASINGSGSQDLIRIGTTTNSTANPIKILSRGNTAFSINYLGAIALATPNAFSSGAGSNITITSGNGNTTGAGGALVITTGNGAGIASGGDIGITSGNSGSTGRAGNITISCGTAAGTSNGANLNLSAGAAGSSGTGGGVAITAGASATSGTGGDITLTVGTGATANGKVNFVNTNVANGTVACVFTASAGPTGAGTAIAGWLAIKVGGTSRYMPYW